MRGLMFSLWTALTAPVAAPAAEPPAVLTLLEGGSAMLLRDGTTQVLAEGMRLQSGDRIETRAGTLAQIEFADGVIVSVGPESRFHLVFLAERGKGVSEFALMRGWSKFKDSRSAAPFRYQTPWFSVHGVEGIAVMRVSEQGAELFVETGELRIAEDAMRASVVTVRGEHFYARAARDGKGTVSRYIAAGFLNGIPKTYFDNLPVRLSRYRQSGDVSVVKAAPRATRDDMAGAAPVSRPAPAAAVSAPAPFKATIDQRDVDRWLQGPSPNRQQIWSEPVVSAEEFAVRRTPGADAGSTPSRPNDLQFRPAWENILLPQRRMSGPNLNPR